ncbi:hypothetical protein BS78_01G460000 [Paspalum vaginatum]|nr:hypothetical protein BS78_01G460000 [Paspalum vaginatum]
MAADEQQQQQTAKAAAGRFAVTCGQLRQYMREQAGSGARCLAPAVAMGLMPGAGGPDAAAAADLQAAPAPDQAETTAVLELFPQQAGTLKDEQHRTRKEPAERAPLTIFYGGKMVVFDDFPAEKADEIMQLVAGTGNTSAEQNNALGQPTAGLTDMPLARKVSLKRFLEKRKNRLTAADPYPASAAASESTTSTKPAVKQEGTPWLGVNSALSLS